VKRRIHPKTVQSILGHARFAITMDLYSHLMDGAHEEAAEALDELLGGR
jgi:integrase